MRRIDGQTEVFVTMPLTPAIDYKFKVLRLEGLLEKEACACFSTYVLLFIPILWP